MGKMPIATSDSVGVERKLERLLSQFKLRRKRCVPKFDIFT